MIELLDGMPSGTVGVRARGVVQPADYEEVLIPAIERARADHEHVNVLYVLGPDFESYSAGAVWDDTRYGARHLTGWGRIALVSDHDWVRHAVGVGRLVMPGHLRHFPMAELGAARAWATGAPA